MSASISSALAVGLPLMTAMLERAYIGGIPSSRPFITIEMAFSGVLTPFGRKPERTRTAACSRRTVQASGETTARPRGAEAVLLFSCTHSIPSQRRDFALYFIGQAFYEH